MGTNISFDASKKKLSVTPALFNVLPKVSCNRNMHTEYMSVYVYDYWPNGPVCVTKYFI